MAMRATAIGIETPMPILAPVLKSGLEALFGNYVLRVEEELVAEVVEVALGDNDVVVWGVPSKGTEPLASRLLVD